MIKSTIKSAAVSWQTTLMGAIAALMVLLSHTGAMDLKTLVEALALLGLGTAARSATKSSEDHK